MQTVTLNLFGMVAILPLQSRFLQRTVHSLRFLAINSVEHYCSRPWVRHSQTAFGLQLSSRCW